MKKIFTIIIGTCMMPFFAKAQNTFPKAGRVGIFTTSPNSSAALDIDTTGLGLLIPRMTQAQRNAIVAPATSLLIYQKDNTHGFYYYDGNAWVSMTSKSANKSLSNLTATSINKSLIPDTTAKYDLGSSTKSWKQAWFSSDITVNGLTIGRGPNSDYSNTAIGLKSLLSNISGQANTAIGSYSMSDNTTGFSNTAVGASSLTFNVDGAYNIATGGYALHGNTSGTSNCAFGFSSLYQNSTGSDNTAIGHQSLFNNDSGDANVAVGTISLRSNTSGSYNVAIGNEALGANTIGNQNTAAGSNAMYKNTTGASNTAFGDAALYFNTTGNDNSCFGFYSQVTDGMSNATAIGYSAIATASNQVRIGNSSVTAIGGSVDWGKWSDGRFKKNIKENVPGLAFINKLKPVTYNLDVAGLRKFLGEDVVRSDSKQKSTNDEKSKESIKKKEAEIQTGFVAQDVEKAANELGYKFSGVDKPENDNTPYALRYSEFVVPLVRAVQELSKKNDDKDGKIDALQKQIDELKAMIINNANTSSAVSNQPKISSSQLAKLDQNQPNPTAQSTTIKYFIPDQIIKAVIKITNANGQEIKSINLSQKSSGQISLQTNDLTGGTYFYSLVTDGKIIDTKKIIIAH